MALLTEKLDTLKGKGTIELGGAMYGNVKSTSLFKLLSSETVYGDIDTSSLNINQNAIFVSIDSKKVD